MEPGELPDTTIAVSMIHLRQMRWQVSYLRRWVSHLVGKVWMLGNENSMLHELAHRQAKRIERLEDGILVRLPPSLPPALGRSLKHCRMYQPSRGH